MPLLAESVGRVTPPAIVSGMLVDRRSGGQRGGTMRTCSARLGVAFTVVALVAAATTHARLPADAPPLPPPDPGVLTVVPVDTVQELADACWNLASSQAIVIAPGTYDLTNHAFPNGVDGRLTVGRYGASPISNIQIRGATGRPEDVVILGGGMANDIVPFGFQVFTATDVLIADLSVGLVYYHAVAIQNDQGATRVTLRHCRLFDAGQQVVKGNRGSNPGAEDVVVEYCEVFLTAGAIHHPDLGYCYTNGIDAIGGRRWVIRDNLIRGFWCQDGTLAGPAILMWQGSLDTVVERNTILDSSRGVSLGLVGPSDHNGGVVRNNFIRWQPDATYEVDVAIYTASPGSKVVHNTVLTHGLYQPNGPVAVEVRFAGATGVEVRANLMDGGVWARDGAAPLVADNLTTASTTWFVDEAAGDLHLLPSAPATDLVIRHADCVDDFDATLRPGTAVVADVGGDELGLPLFADNFETGDTTAWSAAVP